MFNYNKNVTFILYLTVSISTTHSYLSLRGFENVYDYSLPWRFVPQYRDLYDKETNPNGIISFSTAENIHIPTENFNYTASSNGGPYFPKLMAAHINKYFSPHIPVTSDNIITGNGVTAVQSMLAFCIGDEGDGVLVSPPSYGRFEIDYKSTARVKIIYATLNGVSIFDKLVVERLEDEIKKASDAGIRVKALLISNPNNPLGHCYPRETLIALMAFCQRHSIHLISDEVYALSVFSPTNSTSPPFTSVLSIDKKNLIDPNLVHALYGMSKDFGSAGLKIGCLITQNESLLKCCKSITRFHHTSAPSLEIANGILKRPDFVHKFLALSQKRLNKGYEITVNFLETAGIPYFKGGNAGFFIFIDLSKYLVIWNTKQEAGSNPEFALAQHLKEHGVFVHPREEHSEVPGWYRLVFASMSIDDLRVGLD
ncbi:hypothetical protein EPUL_004554, partial [Erysiphe pulchra]